MTELAEQGEQVDSEPVGMTVESIRLAIYQAADLTMPRLDPKGSLSANVELVQGYLIETAIARSMLERARLYAHDALGVIRDQWDAIPRDAYVNHLNGARTTNLQLDAAKAVVEPELADSIRTVKRLIDRLTDQIKRLELDDRAASRIYTMLTGS